MRLSSKGERTHDRRLVHPLFLLSDGLEPLSAMIGSIWISVGIDHSLVLAYPPLDLYYELNSTD